MAFHAPKLLPLSLAILMAMPSTVLAAQDKHAPCTGNEATGSIEPTPANLFPVMAAGWGPELGGGRMASRWAEDWTGMALSQRAPPLKAMGLGDSASLTISAELRLREMSTRNKGLVAGANADQMQLRAILGADLRLTPSLRFYGEVGTGQVDADRQSSAPNFQNQIALQQLFADVRGTHGTMFFGAMVGRQEFADGPRQLISLSDGPNLHRSWNGIRAYLHAPRYRIGAFELRATRLGSGAFDDGVQSDIRLRGINASIIVSSGEGPNTYLDPFWYRTENPAFRLGTDAGLDRRDTVGLRLWGRKGVLRWDWTLAQQTGRSVAERSIDAWALFAVQSLSLSETGWKPRLTSHVDVATGGGAYGAGPLRVFNPLYASSNYLGESQFLGLTNLFLFAPGISIAPSSKTTVSFEYAYARRLNTADAAYGAGMHPYSGTEHAAGFHIGNLAHLNAAWVPTPSVTVNANLEYLDPGRVLRNANLPSGTYGYLGATYRY